MATTPDPRGLSWDVYCARMEELFSAQQIGHVDEVDWKLWVDNLQGIGIFSMSGVPNSISYNKWQDWAEAIVGIMSIPNT